MTGNFINFALKLPTKAGKIILDTPDAILSLSAKTIKLLIAIYLFSKGIDMLGILNKSETEEINIFGDDNLPITIEIPKVDPKPIKIPRWIAVAIQSKLGLGIIKKTYTFLSNKFNDQNDPDENNIENIISEALKRRKK